MTDDEADHISYPALIVEVLSDDSTAGYDRGDKFNLLYKRLESLWAYVLVDTRKVAVDVYRRWGDSWPLQSYDPDGDVALESMASTIPISSFYKRIAL